MGQGENPEFAICTASQREGEAVESRPARAQYAKTTSMTPAESMRSSRHCGSLLGFRVVERKRYGTSQSATIIYFQISTESSTSSIA